MERGFPGANAELGDEDGRGRAYWVRSCQGPPCRVRTGQGALSRLGGVAGEGGTGTGRRCVGVAPEGEGLKGAPSPFHTETRVQIRALGARVQGVLGRSQGLGSLLSPEAYVGKDAGVPEDPDCSEDGGPAGLPRGSRGGFLGQGMKDGPRSSPPQGRRPGLEAAGM